MTTTRQLNSIRRNADKIVTTLTVALSFMSGDRREAMEADRAAFVKARDVAVRLISEIEND